MKTDTVACVLGLVLVLVLCPARAAADTVASRERAQAFIDKATDDFGAKRFSEALENFETAYSLWPSPVILYNIGQTNIELGRSVEVVAAFERYLADGGTEIWAERKAYVRQVISQHLAKIRGAVAQSAPDRVAPSTGKKLQKTLRAQPALTVAQRTGTSDVG